MQINQSARQQNKMGCLELLRKYFTARYLVYGARYFSYSHYNCSRRLKKQVGELLRKEAKEASASAFKIKRPNETTQEKSDEKEVRRALDELGMFKLPKVLKYYQLWSTIVHAINVCAVALVRLNESAKLLDIHLICYMGLIVVHEDAPPRQMMWSGWILSLMHLSWRYLMFRSEDCRCLLFDDFSASNLGLVKEAIKFRSQPSGQYSRVSISLLRERIFFDSKRRRCGGAGGEKRKLNLIQRPNRTTAAWRQLNRVAKLSAIGWTVVFVPVGVVLLFLGFRVSLLKQAVTYANCKDANSNVSTYIYWHRATLSLLLGTTHALDNFVALLDTIIISPLASFDLLIYWKSIALRLESARNVLRAAHLDATRRRRGEWRLATEAPPPRFNLMIPLEPRNNLITRDDEHIRAECRQIQDSLCDFFDCVRQANYFVTVLNLFWLANWLCLTTATTIVGFKTLTDIAFVRIVGLLSLLVTLFACCFALLVRRAVRPTYQVLCTIMALDKSAEEKLRWKAILEYYSPMKQYAFRFFGDKVFSEIACLKIISFSLTIFAVFETVLQRGGETE